MKIKPNAKPLIQSSERPLSLSFSDPDISSVFVWKEA